MNRNLRNALTVVASLGLAATASAQWDWDPVCIDPNANPRYAPGTGTFFLENDLFAVNIGISGSANSYLCTPIGETTPFTLPISGRFSFSSGAVGSRQDEFQGFAAADSDDFLRFNFGGNVLGFGGLAPSGGGWSYARIDWADADGTNVGGAFYGSGGISLGFQGLSGRYAQINRTFDAGNIEVRLKSNIIGDAAKLEWSMYNRRAAARRLGLRFGQLIWIMNNQGVYRGYTIQRNSQSFTQPYILVPGEKPRVTDQGYGGVSPLTGQAEPTVPPAVNFTGGRSTGFGLQVINADTPDVVDQNGQSILTATVNRFVIGDGFFILGGLSGAAADPNFNPDALFADAAMGNLASYYQEWTPETVLGNGSQVPRVITAIYKSTWGDSNYTGGYAAVVDTPKVLSTDPATGTFQNNPFNIRVVVDNTDGFAVVNQSVTMTNVKITLDLPQGLHAPGNPAQRRLIQYIPAIQPITTAERVFAVEADSNVSGELPYTVTIEPTIGGSKVIRGKINFAATPQVLLRRGANLVTLPWSFSTNSWDAILGLNLNTDFQAYTYDATLGSYVPQSGPARGVGTWIVSQSDLGFIGLGGSPSQPQDQFSPPSNGLEGGAQPIRLVRGWNLIGNPYNFSFPIGQLVGVPEGTTTTFTYQQMVAGGLINAAFSLYDPDLRNYRTVQNAEERLQPNYGYWIYATQPIALVFPPIYDLFTRGQSKAKTELPQDARQWRLQVAASTATSYDGDNFAGISSNAQVLRSYNAQKPPAAPTRDAIRGYFRESVGGRAAEFAQVTRNSRGRQTFFYNVYSRLSNQVTVSWPNLKNIPSNLDVKVTDLVTGRAVSARSSKGYTYLAEAEGTRPFRIDITPTAIAAPRIGTVNVRQAGRANLRNVEIRYQLSGGGLTTIRVLRNGQYVGTIVEGLDSESGINTVNWAARLTGDAPAPAGNYVLELTVVGDGGGVTRRLVGTRISG